MNRQILKYAYPISVLILLVFAWVVGQRLSRGVEAIVPLAVVAAVVWLLGVVAFVFFWPRITVDGFRRAILKGGFGAGPIPVNTLYAVRDRPSQSAAAGGLMAAGTDDLVYLAGWLDLKPGPQVLHVPDMAGRYYSLQFTDPDSGANVAYVGKRTTGTATADFLLSDRRSSSSASPGRTRIELPSSALVIGRVFCANDEDRLVAHALAMQIELTPLGNQPA